MRKLKMKAEVEKNPLEEVEDELDRMDEEEELQRKDDEKEQALRIFKTGSGVKIVKGEYRGDEGVIRGRAACGDTVDLSYTTESVDHHGDIKYEPDGEERHEVTVEEILNTFGIVLEEYIYIVSLTATQSQVRVLVKESDLEPISYEEEFRDYLVELISDGGDGGHFTSSQGCETNQLHVKTHADRNNLDDKRRQDTFMIEITHLERIGK